MSLVTRMIVLLVGVVLIAVGIWYWREAGYMELYSSLGITLGFSFLVVGVDEWMHAARHARHGGSATVTAH